MTTSTGGFRTVREVAGPPGAPHYVHPEWQREFPWLAQGVTSRGGESEPFDLGFGGSAAREVLARWERFAKAMTFQRMVHGRQVHGTSVRMHEAGPPGLYLAPACDGHATRAAGVLLTVGLADCVGASLVASARRAVAVLHCGWRGIAQGILERGLETLEERLAVSPTELHFHLGPAICGSCYEVGPEVHQALGRPVPARPAPVDLRVLLAERARAAGVPRDQITISELCTRCGESPFFSHRGGSTGRQVAFIGIRD